MLRPDLPRANRSWYRRRVAKPQIPTTPVPLFPLPGAFLFPHQVLPLHVFEERYRELVRDLLDGPGRFVIATILVGEQETADHSPAVLPVAGYGEIVRHEKLPDGRYLIWVVGLLRVRIREVESDRLYRRVVCERFVEQQPGEAEAEALTQQLHAAAKARIKGPLPLPPSTAPDLLADLLVQTLGASQEVLERVFTEPSVSARARIVLDAAGEAGENATPD